MCLPTEKSINLLSRSLTSFCISSSICCICSRCSFSSSWSLSCVSCISSFTFSGRALNFLSSIGSPSQIGIVIMPMLVFLRRKLWEEVISSISLIIPFFLSDPFFLSLSNSSLYSPPSKAFGISSFSLFIKVSKSSVNFFPLPGFRLNAKGSSGLEKL